MLMPLPHETAISLWSRALAAEIGIAIATNSRRALANDLYDARKAAGQAEFSKISIHMPPNPEELWMVRKDAEEPEPPVDIEDSFEEL